MMAKTQITLETEMQRRARQRANAPTISGCLSQSIFAVWSHGILLVLRQQAT